MQQRAGVQVYGEAAGADDLRGRHGDVFRLRPDGQRQDAHDGRRLQRQSSGLQDGHLRVGGEGRVRAVAQPEVPTPEPHRVRLVLRDLQRQSVRLVVGEEQAARAGGRQAAGADRRSDGARRRQRGGSAEAHPARQQHANIWSDVGERQLVALARGVPAGGASRRLCEDSRQVLVHRSGGQRAGQGHIVGQPSDAHGGRGDQQVTAGAQGVHPRPWPAERSSTFPCQQTYAGAARFLHRRKEQDVHDCHD